MAQHFEQRLRKNVSPNREPLLPTALDLLTALFQNGCYRDADGSIYEEVKEMFRRGIKGFLGELVVD